MPQETSVSPFRALRAASPTDRNRTQAPPCRPARVNVCRRDIILVPPTIHQASRRSKLSTVYQHFLISRSIPSTSSIHDPRAPPPPPRQRAESARHFVRQPAQQK